MGVVKSIFRAVGSLLGGGDAPAPPPAPVAPPPLQAEKAPAIAAFRRSNKNAAGPGGALAGNSSTLLTGPAGVDTSGVSLGKSTLLGQ